jgi:hypothetical protein
MNLCASMGWRRFRTLRVIFALDAMKQFSDGHHG